MNISEKIKQIDLVEIVQQSGIELTSTGHRFSGRCPFHEDQTPSFFVFPDNHFKCFGCGVHGDAADFIQRLYNCDFKQALAYLGIVQGSLSFQANKRIQKRKNQKALIKLFREWERCAIHTYAVMVRATYKATTGMTIEEFDQYGQILEPLSYWEHSLDICTGGDDEQKYLLFMEHKQKGIKLLRRSSLFRSDFDYKGWLNKTERTDG